MKIKIISIVLAMSLVSFAEVKSLQGYSSNATFYQFTHDEPTNTGDYHDYRRNEQNWLGAQMISLTIGSECDVWLSNYVDSWYSDIPALHDNVYNMEAEKYGAWQLNGEKTWVGNGQSALVTYQDSEGDKENSTLAYFLGHFDGGEIIAVWMTTLETDGGEQVDSWQFVNDDNHDTTLASRLDGTHDQANNVRINFGLTTVPEGYGREFVMLGVTDASMPTGEPLPGVWMSALLCLSVVIGATKARKTVSRN